MRTNNKDAKKVCNLLEQATGAKVTADVLNKSRGRHHVTFDGKIDHSQLAADLDMQIDSLGNGRNGFGYVFYRARK